MLGFQGKLLTNVNKHSPPPPPSSLSVLFNRPGPTWIFQRRILGNFWCKTSYRSFQSQNEQCQSTEGTVNKQLINELKLMIIQQARHALGDRYPRPQLHSMSMLYIWLVAHDCTI